METRRPRWLWLAVVPDVLAVAVALLLAFAATWANYMVHALLDQQGDEFAYHLVMTSGTSEGQAMTLAAQLQREFPSSQVHVIGEAEARGLLALQEPWVRKLPEMELARLPLMIELRHPGLLGKPIPLQDEIQQAIEAAPEVDFSIFNDVGFENLLVASRKIKQYADSVVGFVGLAALLLLFLYAIRLGVAAVYAPAVGLMARVVIAWIAGTVLAFLGLTLLSGLVAGDFDVPKPGMLQQLLMSAWALALMFVGALVPRLTHPRGER